MQVTLVLASSVNGKLTKGSDTLTTSWNSPEDKTYFKALRDSYQLVLMGRRTYEAIKADLVLNPEILRVVLTRSPKKFATQSVTGQLEFSNASPQMLLEVLEKRGYSKALLVGGNEVASAFLKAGLVDILSLTIEPFLFGSGVDFFDIKGFHLPLTLLQSSTLNENGTLLLTYQVKRDDL